MWGYIVLKPYLSKAEQVPSLYVRVYRSRESCPGFWICSLIICEGISVSRARTELLRAFPHYMWGYIAITAGREYWRAVPSLYVRVYREESGGGVTYGSSLIICEGISRKRTDISGIQKFPHYMWGYIEAGVQLPATTEVPSLYVRVYRATCDIFTVSPGSLIICEGISLRRFFDYALILFPHYMWVYIEIGNGILQASKNINVVDDSIPQIA